jgi:hypothetical protein
MFKKTENPTACETRSVIRFFNAKEMKPAEIHIVNFVTCTENMPRVVQWYGDGRDCLVKDAKMCMMICGAATQNLITTFGWEQFDHPPYIPVLAPSDFYLFLHLKSFLAGRQFHDDNKVKEAVTTRIASQAASFYDEGIQKTGAAI